MYICVAAVAQRLITLSPYQTATALDSYPTAGLSAALTLGGCKDQSPTPLLILATVHLPLVVVQD
jgi:hypothetical protein